MHKLKIPLIIAALSAATSFAQDNCAEYKIIELNGQKQKMCVSTFEMQQKTEQDKKPQQLLPQPAQAPVAAPAPAQQQYKEPTMAEIQKNLPKVLNNAIDNPSPQNVRQFYMLWKLAQEKATRFSIASRMAAIRYPELSAGSYASNAAIKAQESKSRKMLKDFIGALIESGHKIGFAYNLDCEYSKQSVPVLAKFLSDTSFKLVAVNVGPRAGLEGPFENLRPAIASIADGKDGHKLGAKWGLMHTPTFFIVTPDNQFFSEIKVDGAGFANSSGMQEAILNTFYDAGQVNDQFWLETVGFSNLTPTERMIGLKAGPMNIAPGSWDQEAADFAEKFFPIPQDRQ